MPQILTKAPEIKVEAQHQGCPISPKEHQAHIFRTAQQARATFAAFAYAVADQFALENTIYL